MAAFSAKLSEKVSKEIVSVVPHLICKQFMAYDRSCCHLGAEINLSAEKLETVANGDWTNWDFESFEAEGQKCNFDKQMELLPANLRLDTKVFASVNFEIYTAKPPQDPTSPYSMKLAEEQFMKENNVIKS